MKTIFSTVFVFTLITIFPCRGTEDSTANRSKDSTILLEKMTVTAKRVTSVLTSPKLESPGLQLAVSEISKKDMQTQDAVTVVDAINLVPGSLTETRGRKVKQFVSFRGQEYPYPTYALDGAWQREFLEIPYFFSTADIERIEVLRSSAALLTGLSGLSGVVNIVTIEPGAPETDADISYSSYDTRQAHISSSARINDWSYHFGIGGWHTEGPVNKHAAEDIGNGFAKITWKPIDRLTLQTSLFDLYGKRELARAEFPAQTSLQINDETFDPVRTTVWNSKIFYRWNARMSTELLGYYTDRSSEFKTTAFSSMDTIFKNTKITAIDSAFKKTFTEEADYEWGLNLTHALHPFTGNIFRIGGLYNHWSAPNGKRFYIGHRIDRQTISAAALDEQHMGSLSIDMALRWAQTYNEAFTPIHEADLNGVDGKLLQNKQVREITDTWDPPQITASLGSAYLIIPEVSLHANIAVGDIKPRVGALDTSHQELLSEKRIMGDGGLKYDIERLGSMVINAFYTNRINGIEMTGTLDTITKLEYYKNATSDNYGLEIEIRSNEYENIGSTFANIVLMNSRLKDSTGTMIADSSKPSIIIGGGLMLCRGNFDLNLFGKYVSAYYNNRFASTADIQKGIVYQLGNYSTADITAGYTFGPGKSIRTYVTIHNLLDRKFSTVLGYPDFGRRIGGGVQYSIK